MFVQNKFRGNCLAMTELVSSQILLFWKAPVEDGAGWHFSRFWKVAVLVANGCDCMPGSQTCSEDGAGLQLIISWARYAHKTDRVFPAIMLNTLANWPVGCNRPMLTYVWLVVENLLPMCETANIRCPIALKVIQCEVLNFAWRFASGPAHLLTISYCSGTTI